MKCVSYTRTLPWKNHQSELTIAEQNQRIAAYLAEHKELDLLKKYSDRKNDEKARTAFDQMTDDGVERKFDCIIVASMYYCGPDFPAARQAIKETLYATGIDLIVLDEGLDTRTASRKEVEDYFEAKRCEMHAEIMFAWRRKQGAGFRLTNSVPFGYLRRNGESNMIKDEEVAPYLSEAFSRYASGQKMRDIAKWLNEQGVEPPMRHKKRILGKPYDAESDQWTTDMLRCLFRNPTYTGAATNGSRQIIAENCHEPYITKEQFHAFPCNMREGENKISIRKSYKKPNPLAKHIVCICGRALCWHKLFAGQDKRDLPKEQWYVAKNTHPAIIARDDFEKVQKILNKNRAVFQTVRAKSEQIRAEYQNDLAGMVFCADCGRQMEFERLPHGAEESKKVCYYICKARQADDKCIGHQIPEKLLKALIMDQLHLFIVQLSDKRKVLEELQKIEDVQNPVYRAKGEIMSLTDKVSQMAKKREQLYADYVAGVVDSEDYQLIREDYSRQYDSLRAALQEAENKKVQVEQQIEEYLNMTSHLEEHLDNFEFDIHLVKTLVQRIEVSTDKRIRIVFGFRDIFAEAEKESAEK